MNADNQQPRLEEIGWLAGMIDGEGSIGAYLRQGVKTPHYKPIVQISGTHEGGLEYLHNLLDRLEIGHHIVWHQRKSPNYKRAWNISIVGMKRIPKLLNTVIPFMQIKREQANCLMEWIQLRQARPMQSAIANNEEALVKLIRIANSRGLNDYTSSNES